MNRYASRLLDRRFMVTTAVDTGMHVGRRSLDKAVEFISGDAITRPTLRRRLMLAFAVDFPGVVLCYHVGGQQFRQIRQDAEHRLGAGFDIRKLLDAVLTGGAIPFPLLEKRVQQRVT